jgi:hypothetical protein
MRRSQEKGVGFLLLSVGRPFIIYLLLSPLQRRRLRGLVLLNLVFRNIPEQEENKKILTFPSL